MSERARDGISRDAGSVPALTPCKRQIKQLMNIFEHDLGKWKRFNYLNQVVAKLHNFTGARQLQFESFFGGQELEIVQSIFLIEFLDGLHHIDGISVQQVIEFLKQKVVYNILVDGFLAVCVCLCVLFFLQQPDDIVAHVEQIDVHFWLD